MLALSTILCCFAAALFWTCNALLIVIGTKKAGMWGSANKDVYLQLLPDNIINEWIGREQIKELEFASGILNGVFWIVFSLPIIEMAWILSRNGTRSVGVNTGIMVFALAGSWTKWFSNIFWNGMYLSLMMLAMNFNLDNWMASIQDAQYQLDGEDGIGWRALEMNYIVSKGLVWIVNAVEWVCLSGIFTMTFLSVHEWRRHDQSTFGAKWNALGLFIGLISAVNFIAEIVGVEGYRIAWIFVVLYSSLTRLVLIPLWIIILGFQLPMASSKQFDSGTSDLELSEDQQERRDLRPSAFTIDENDEGEGDVQDRPTSPPMEAFSSTSPTAASSLADTPKSQETTASLLD